MKQLFRLSAIAGLILLSCGNPASDNIRAFIPGTYTKEINDEFTKGRDTIFISVLDDQSGSYSVIRQTSYRQSIDEKILSPRVETHKMTAIYNAATKQLTEQSQGKAFSFSPDKNLLSTGGSAYRKIGK